MPTPQMMKSVVREYLESYNSGDAEKLVALFSENAVVEDPVGSGTVHRGKLDVTEFYRACLKQGTQLELKGRISGSHGNAAALAIEVHASVQTKRVNVSVIDVVTFDDDCRIESMKCYWGPDDITYS